MRRPPRLRPSRPSRSGAPSRPEVGGAPIVLPAWLDALSDRWWGLTPRLRFGVVVVLLVLVASASAVRVVASPYGAPVTVLVAASDLPVGAAIDDAAVRAVRWPQELAPTRARDLATGTLTAPLPEGAVLTDAHVTDGGLGGVVGPGRVGVPLPAELVADLPVGAAVQVIASTADGGGLVLADRAEVVAHDGVSLWLAVAEDVAADVAAAGLRGTVALAVVPLGAGDPP